MNLHRWLVCCLLSTQGREAISKDGVERNIYCITQPTGQHYFCHFCDIWTFPRFVVMFMQLCSSKVLPHEKTAHTVSIFCCMDWMIEKISQNILVLGIMTNFTLNDVLIHILHRKLSQVLWLLLLQPHHSWGSSWSASADTSHHFLEGQIGRIVFYRNLHSNHIFNKLSGQFAQRIGDKELSHFNYM